MKVYKVEFKQFVDFLIENGCYDKFVTNLKLNSIFTNIEDIQNSEQDGRQYIACAFVWNGVPEGREYWEALDFRWCATVVNEIGVRGERK